MAVNVTALHFITQFLGQCLILFKALPENTRLVMIFQGTRKSKSIGNG